MDQLYETDARYGIRPTWGSILAKTYRLYWNGFWMFLRIGLPVALLTYLFTPIRRVLTKSFDQWLASLISKGLATHLAELWVLASLRRLVIGAVYWLLSAVLFAAIAANLIPGENEKPRHISDAYSMVRERLGQVLALGLLTWVVFSISRSIILVAWWPLLEHFSFRPGGISESVIAGVPTLIIVGLVSRAGLAIPELMTNSASSVKNCIRSSINKTEGWELFFMFFVSKSAIVGYAVYWLTQRAFELILQRMSPDASLYYWFTWAIYVCLFALLASPLFIAFSVLYPEVNAKQDATTTAAPIR